MSGGRTRIRTLDPLIKSQQITHIYQAHFDISSVRSGIEPKRKSENVETRFKGKHLATGSQSRAVDREPLAMPGLKNTRHEVFCREVVKGSSKAAAYEKAGFVPDTSNASKL